MITQGKVVSVSGGFAMVEVDRKSACEGCSKSKEGCVVCSLGGGGSSITLRVRNSAGASTGDIVAIDTDTRRVLGYAWLVFLMPLLVAAGGYWLGTSLFGGETGGFILAAAGIVLSFGGLWLYSKLVVGRRCDAEVVSIIKRAG
ncbi:MAG: SoxR reducing system RseC family protein [Clostridiales bacterium]|nr:SoxR reducing system RseC family protein [Clostridiales bacterium]HOA85333.1 SoxR reducing system RseC family protein [Bacillota bacterium]